jgi:hypothetical protein
MIMLNEFSHLVIPCGRYVFEVDREISEKIKYREQQSQI